MLLLYVLNQGNVSDSSMSALVLHRNASLCYIIIILLTGLYPNWDIEIRPDRHLRLVSNFISTP